MDYGNLIAEIRASGAGGNACAEKWAAAVEALLAERKALLRELEKATGCRWNASIAPERKEE